MLPSTAPEEHWIQEKVKNLSVRQSRPKPATQLPTSSVPGTVHFLINPQARSAGLIETQKSLRPILDGVVKRDNRIHLGKQDRIHSRNLGSLRKPWEGCGRLCEEHTDCPHRVATSPEKTRPSCHCWRLLRETELEPGAPHLCPQEAEFLGHHLARRSGSLLCHALCELFWALSSE